MAVQGWMFSQKEHNLEDEASQLLSFRALGTRMSQVDDILKRKTEAALCALDGEDLDKQESSEELLATKELQRKEKIVKELLKKVKKRRKLVRSYSYFTWFCAFFACFLGNLYIKAQLNEHLFSVDESIKNRIVDILPIGNIGSNAQFYDWMLQVVVDVFEDSVCGNGVCEPPLEYPGLGRFGCAADCGLYPQRTSLRIDVQSAWTAGMGGLDFSGFNISSGDPPVKFTYNIYSETMGAYLLAADATQASVTVDVPDGNLRLELYQVGLVSPDTPGRYLSTYGGVARGTTPPPRKRFDYQYGDPAEAIATMATVNRKLHYHCTSDPNNASAQCKGDYDPAAMGEVLRNRYGLAGNVSMIFNGKDRQNLVTFPFCALVPSVIGADAMVDPSMCTVPGWTSSASKCYNASILAQSFVCPGNYSFSLWAFGPPRNVSVKPRRAPPTRTLTPYNNVIGGIIVTQYIRKTVACPYQNSESISTLTGRFTCQAVDRADVPFGIDPVFLPSSKLYNGKLMASDFYTPQEMFNGTDDPLSFYPHQWDIGNPKPEALISSESFGVYKLFFDARLSAARSRQLVQFMKDGMFLNNKTDWIEMEIITYNADFNLFGILTVQFRWNLGGSTLWTYQYNTALLSPYEGTKGLISMSFDIVFGAMLLADIVRECRDIYNCILRENLINGYIMKFWNWVEWIHFGLLLSGFFFWTGYNQYISAIGFKSEYPVLRDLEASARFFATDPANELDLLDFTIKMRKLSDLKNFWTALSCVNILLFVMRFLNVLDFQPRMSLITRTLQLASVDLGHYLTLFSIILIGYATIGTVLLGERLKQFQTFGDACAALFMILMAWEPQTMYTSMSSATNQAKIGATIVSFQIFFWSWVLIATFIMLNIVLAIIVEAFSHIKASLKEAPTITAESLSVLRQTLRMLGNRILGQEWLISDKELEKVLVAHDRSFQSRKNFLKSVGQIRGTIKSRCVRIPGGLQVSDRDLEKLLEGHACTGRKSVLAKAKGFLSKKKNLSRPRSVSNTSRRLSLIGSGTTNTKEDGIDIAEDHGYCPPVPIADLMNRYGEVVVDGQDDEEMLRLLQTENIKREMALYATQDKIREHVETVVETLESMADFVLPTEEIKKLREVRQGVRNQEAKLGSKNIGQSNMIFDGTLRVIVVAAKRLPKLDLFAESDPYCVLILEEKTAHKGSNQTVLAATDTRMNDPNPIWNSEHEFPLQCSAETNLVAAVLDRDEVGSDEMIGMIRISMSDLPVNEELDRWYRLRNDASPNLTKRALVRLKICLIPGDAELDEGRSPFHGHGPPAGSRPRRSSEIEGELRWLKECLNNTADSCQPKCSGILEVTVVSAASLPRRGKLFTKLSICDPYVKVAYNDVEFVSIVRKNTYGPEWGQSFAFELEDISNVGPLCVTVMDWNKFLQHDLIGIIDITQDQIQHILFETFADWNQQHTFPILKNGLTVEGFDGKISQITLSFRCTVRKTGEMQRPFDVIEGPLPEQDPLITCDLLGGDGSMTFDVTSGSQRAAAGESDADSRHEGDTFRNPSVNGADFDTGIELHHEFKPARDLEITGEIKSAQTPSLAERYRMASRLVSNTGAVRPRDCQEPICSEEKSPCLPATLHQDHGDVEMSSSNYSTMVHVCSNGRPRRRQIHE